MINSIQQKITNHKERGFYEGGKKTLANRDFWNGGDATFEELASYDRNTMRSRARWLSANNAIMSNIDRSIINNVVGVGVALDYDGTNKRLNKAIMDRFNSWANNRKLCDITQRLTFSDIQCSTIKSCLVDGEIYIHKIVTEEGLKLRLIEADNLDESMGVGGVEIDKYGVPVRYHFRDLNNDTFSIPSSDIINYYQSERPSQYRGVSDYKQAIIDIKNFSAFQSSTIQAARARANIGYTVTSPAPSGVFTQTVDGVQIEEIGGVAVKYLKPGEELKKLDPENGGNDFKAFSEISIRLMATARSVSYELAFKDFSKVNYASSRASLLQDYKRFDYEQNHLKEYFLDEIFEAWLDIEVMAGRIKIPKYLSTDKNKYLIQRWTWPQRPWVDPLKDVNAIEKEIELGITNASDVAIARGNNYEVNMQKLSEQLKLQESLDVYDEMHPNKIDVVDEENEDDIEDKELIND